MGNTWGQLFRVTTWGESHGGATGAVVDGCPSRLPLSPKDIQPDLDRRAPGQSALVSQRKESDTVQILSGVFEGQTLGTPISLLIPNEDMRPGDYREVREKYRPSHADFTYDAKYGVRDWRGGGRTSARETAGRVAAAAIARKLLSVRFNVTVVAWVSKVGRLVADVRPRKGDAGAGRHDADPLPRPRHRRAHDRGRRSRAQGWQLARRRRHLCRARLPGRLGRAGVRPAGGRPRQGRDEPAREQGLRDRLGLRRDRPHAAPSTTTSSTWRAARIRTRTNRSGGVQGGITNGETIYFRVAFKPTATIMREQNTVDIHHEETTIQGRGRHDPCVLPRAVPMVEAMAALVLADHALRHQAVTEPNPRA